MSMGFFNFNLNNRRLTYNQDFYAKKNLSIHPSETFYANFPAYPTEALYTPGNSSFTYPLENQATFTVESGVEANFVAGNEISLKGEIHFKSGSEVTLKVVPGDCYSVQRLAESPIEENALNRSSTYHGLDSVMTTEEKNHHVEVFPNPFKDSFFLSTNNHSSIFSYRVFSVTGKEVLSGIKPEGISRISLEGFAKGIYILKVFSDKEAHNFKLIKK
jgi:hypothetical protein